MIFNAVLKNPQHEESGEAAVPFPIPPNEYEPILEQLEALELGDAVRQDCRISKMDSACPILKRLAGGRVNLDELDYLAKRLNSFTDQEAAQFQAAAVKFGINGIKDLINLTFCCQQTTVITDFSDLNQIGRDHYLTLHGGCVPTEKLEQLDTRQFALSLICNADGYVTPYGVIYDNGMEMEELYDGTHFPCYLYDQSELILEVPSQTGWNEASTWLYLPMPERQIKRLLERDCLTPEDAGYRITDSELSPKVKYIAEKQESSILELNKMCAAISALDRCSRTKLDAAIEMAEPGNPLQIEQLAKNLELFDFVPGIKTAAEYGRYLIQESGDFSFDENLENYYDYQAYGEDRLDREMGLFIPEGYVCYRGFLSLDEVMAGLESERMPQMGGM